VNLSHLVTQLRDVLTAEHSAKVADENQNHALVAPKAAESHFLAF
jgi:hypothetical protein